MSKLWFRYSAMNAGKSSALLQVVHNYEEQDMKVLLAKPDIDSKGGRFIVSRIGLAREVDFLISPEMNIKEHVKKLQTKLQTEKEEDYKCVIIDEAQFLSENQVNQLLGLAVEEQIPVICYGLRTDFKTDLFPGSARLLAVAHNLEELKNVCECGRKATMNARKNTKNEFIKEGNQVAIDGEEVTYQSLCVRCYLSKVNNFTN